jgi:diadenylate cyclase
MELIWTLQNLNLYSIIDIGLIAILLFGISFLFRGTQAVPVLRGTILVVVIIIFLSTIPNLIAFRWLSASAITGAAVAIPIIFQPEIRRAMERLGRAEWLVRQPRVAEYERIIDDICTAAAKLSERRHGALIVIERSDPLDDFVETGIRVDSAVTPQLLLTVFFPKTELHDGAVIIRGGRIAAAAAVLPLTGAHDLAKRKVGTRHRAGLGMSEISDAIVVIVSEETGQISVANDGRLIRRLDENRLNTILKTFYIDVETSGRRQPVWENWWLSLRQWRKSPKEETPGAPS